MILTLCALWAAELRADDFGDAMGRRDWRAAAAASAGPAAADRVRHGEALRMGQLPYAALLSWEQAMAADPGVAAAALGPALEAADVVRDDSGLSALVARGVPAGAPPRASAEALVLQARAAFLRGDLQAALATLSAVPLDQPAAAEAMALKAVVLNHAGKPKDALAPLLTAQALGSQHGRDARFVDQLDLNLARSYYAAQNFVKAIEYDAAVDPGGPFWLQAQTERAWAHFMLGDMQGAVGILYTHKSPFFEDYFLAEPHLLRAQSLFLLCYYDAAIEEIDTFEARYAPYRAQLGPATALSPRQAWTEAVAFADTGAVGALPVGVLRAVFTSRVFLDARAAIAEAERERAVLARERAPWSDALGAALEARAQAIGDTVGGVLLAEAHRQGARLDQMLGDVKITRLDVMRLETQRLERAAATGTLAEVAAPVKRKPERRRGTYTWAYQGEYWADELGSYRMVSPSRCVD